MTIRAVLLSVLLLTGCHTFNFFQNESEEEPSLPPVTIQPQNFDLQELYMTKAYETAATRAVNKMLDDTTAFYEVTPKAKIYIKDIVKDSPDLPDGLHTARRAIKEIVGKSGTYIAVTDMSDADYILQSNVSDFNYAGLPAIIFKLGINDKNDQPLKAWNVVIRQMTEDQSWQ